MKSYKKKGFFSFIWVIININWQPWKYRKIDNDYYWYYKKMKREQTSIWDANGKKKKRHRPIMDWKVIKKRVLFFIKFLYNKDKCHETSIQPSCSFNIQGIYRKYMMLGKKRASVEYRRWDSYILLLLWFSAIKK